MQISTVSRSHAGKLDCYSISISGLKSEPASGKQDRPRFLGLSHSGADQPKDSSRDHTKISLEQPKLCKSDIFVSSITAHHGASVRFLSVTCNDYSLPITLHKL